MFYLIRSRKRLKVHMHESVTRRAVVLRKVHWSLVQRCKNKMEDYTFCNFNFMATKHILPANFISFFFFDRDYVFHFKTKI